MAEVEVKGPGAEQARELLSQQKTFDLEWDNADGSLKGPRNIRSYNGIVAGSPKEAEQLLHEYLRATGQFTDPYGGGSPTSASLQRGLEETLPTLAAMGVGAVTRNPALAGAARAGAYAATQGLQALTMPERFQEETLANLPAVAGETAFQGVEGAAGELVGLPFRDVARNVARGVMQGPGFKLTDEQRRVIGPEGPFQEGSNLTGETVFPRLGQYVKGLFKGIDDFVSGALFSRGRTQRHQEQLMTNLNAQSTQIVRDVAQQADPRNTSRAILEFLGHEGSGSRDAYLYSRGLYRAVDADIKALAPGTGFDTTNQIQFLRTTPMGGGQRLQAYANLEDAIARELENRPLGPRTERTEYTTTREVTQEGHQTFAPGSTTVVTSQTPKITEATTARTTSTATPRRTTNLEQSGEATTTTYTNPLESTTTGTQESTQATTTLPLMGRLQTVQPDGTVINQIPLGEAMQLQSAVSSVIRNASDIGLQTAEVRVARAFQAQLSEQIEQHLTTIDPALAARYQQARTFTAEMYQSLRKDTLMKLFQHLEDSPSEFKTFFFGHGGLDALDDIERALRTVDRVPYSQQTNLSMSGAAWLRTQMLPKLRYHLFEEAAAHTMQLGGTVVGSLENLPLAAQTSKSVQELIANGSLVGMKPGALTALYDQFGPQRFEKLLGDKATVRKVLDLDKAYLQTVKADPERTGHIFVMMLQTGGASRALNALGTVALGGAASGAYAYSREESTTKNVLLGVGAGTLLVFAPSMINRLLTDPELFNTVINGIKAGPGSAPFTRAAAQIAAHQTRLQMQGQLDVYRPRGPVQEINVQDTQQPEQPANTSQGLPLVPLGP